MAGKIVWTDLTVENAEEVKAFYEKVVGWKAQGVSMGDYEDYNMVPDDSDDPAAGICHRIGCNEDIPPVWMVYLSVKNIEASLEQVQALGGKILRSPTDKSKFAIIEDPAGAVCTIYQEEQ